MPTPLPEKIWINGPKLILANLIPEARERLAADPSYVVIPDDLTSEARAKYDAYYAERDRRSKPEISGVAKESLDNLEELKVEGRSLSEVDTVFGYNLRKVVVPAQNEEKRIITELAKKPSAEIVANPEVPLVISEVMTKHGIPEYVKPVEPKEPEPVVVEG